jgi:hypothetical protein
MPLRTCGRIYGILTSTCSRELGGGCAIQVGVHINLPYFSIGLRRGWRRISVFRPCRPRLCDLIVDASDAEYGRFPAHRPFWLQDLLWQRVRQLPDDHSDRQSWYHDLCRRVPDTEYLLFCISSGQKWRRKRFLKRSKQTSPLRIGQPASWRSLSFSVSAHRMSAFTKSGHSHSEK